MVANAQTDFSSEYAALNGQITEDGLHQYAAVTLPQDHPFIYAEFNEIVRTLTEGTGVIYLGFSECPWCRCLIPALEQAYRDSGSSGKILCYNALEYRDVRTLDENGNIITEKPATEEYEELVQLLYDHLGPYEGLNDPAIRRIYFPTVVFVRDGEILSVHCSTLEEQTNPYVPLTDEQFDALVD